MIHYISNTTHYTTLLPRIQSMKHTLWIGTADTKGLYVEVGSRPKKCMCVVKSRPKKCKVVVKSRPKKCIFAL